MPAPDGFEGQWFDMKKSTWALLFGVLGALFAKKQGIGISDEALVLRGFGTKSIPWADVVEVRPAKAGAVGALLKSCVVETKNNGVLNLPIHQTVDPAGLIAAFQAKGHLAGV